MKIYSHVFNPLQNNLELHAAGECWLGFGSTASKVSKELIDNPSMKFKAMSEFSDSFMDTAKAKARPLETASGETLSFACLI